MSHLDTTHLETDVLIVGAGGAGMYAAIAAAREGAGQVLLADKSLVGRGGATVMAQMTVAAALGSAVPDHWRGQRVVLHVGGAESVLYVHVNGAPVGTNAYGYTGFVCNLTPHLRRDGENVLAVRVRNEGVTSRWYSGSGGGAVSETGISKVSELTSSTA